MNNVVAAVGGERSDKLVVSRYNRFVKRDERVLGYNARTGSFALLADDVAKALQGNGVLDGIRDTDLLVELGFLHWGEETETVVERYRTYQRRGDLLFLTLAPTLGCNLTCNYCYQNNYRKNQLMSEDVQTSSLKFIRSLVAAGRKNVTCEWYGGEPLLAYEIVLSMSEALRRIVPEEGGQLSPMRIITNGVLLDAGKAEALARVGVVSAQVSFDSLHYDGKTKRGVLDENGGPSLILRNVLSSRAHMQLNVRVNVTSSNSNDVANIINVLDSYGLGNVSYLARADDFEGDTGFITNESGSRLPAGRNGSLPILTGHGDSLSRRKYAQIEQETLLPREDALQLMVEKLTPKGHFCSATDGTMFVIDPEGFISRCWHSAGSPSEAMGNVLDEVLDDVDTSPVAQRWANYTPFRYPACVNCEVLPLCMGGCSHARLFMNASKPPCEAIKEQIQYCVDMVGSRLRLHPHQTDPLAVAGRATASADAKVFASTC